MWSLCLHCNIQPQGWLGVAQASEKSEECCHLVSGCRLGQRLVIAKVPHHQPIRAQHKPCKPKEYLKQGCMPGFPRHGQGMPGLVPLDPSPAQARRPFPRANELLCNVGRTAAAEGGAWGSDPSGRKPDRTKRKKEKEVESQKCPNLVFH